MRLIGKKEISLPKYNDYIISWVMASVLTLCVFKGSLSLWQKCESILTYGFVFFMFILGFCFFLVSVKKKTLILSMETQILLFP